MFGIMLAALVGGPLTTLMLWDSGAVVALAAAPFGGSVAGLVTGVLIAGMRGREPAPTLPIDPPLGPRYARASPERATRSGTASATSRNATPGCCCAGKAVRHRGPCPITPLTILTVASILTIHVTSLKSLLEISRWLTGHKIIAYRD
jgi:hypothetical protein